LSSANVGKRNTKSTRRRRPCANPIFTSTISMSAEFPKCGAEQRLIASWLLDLTRRPGQGSRPLGIRGTGLGFRRGRWTIKAAIDEPVPVPVLTTALYERFSSRAGRFSGQAALRDAIPVRRTSEKIGLDVKRKLGPDSKQPMREQ